jgi:ankyrin repeat protein
MGSLRSLRQPDPTEVKPNPLDEKLLQAVSWSTWHEVITLLARGADPNAKNRRGTTALSEAVRRGRIEIGKSLIEHGAYVNKRNLDGSTPLMIAGLFGGREEEVIRFLLNRGAAIDAVDRDGFTALSRAIQGRHYARATFLIERGASVHIKDRAGKTPLDHLKGVKGTEPSTLRKLLKKHA